MSVRNFSMGTSNPEDYQSQVINNNTTHSSGSVDNQSQSAAAGDPSQLPGNFLRARKSISSRFRQQQLAAELAAAQQGNSELDTANLDLSRPIIIADLAMLTTPEGQASSSAQTLRELAGSYN